MCSCVKWLQFPVEFFLSTIACCASFVCFVVGVSLHLRRADVARRTVVVVRRRSSIFPKQVRDSGGIWRLLLAGSLCLFSIAFCGIAVTMWRMRPMNAMTISIAVSCSVMCSCLCYSHFFSSVLGKPAHNVWGLSTRIGFNCRTPPLFSPPPLPFFLLRPFTKLSVRCSMSPLHSWTLAWPRWQGQLLAAEIVQIRHMQLAGASINRRS